MILLLILSLSGPFSKLKNPLDWDDWSVAVLQRCLRKSQMTKDGWCEAIARARSEDDDFHTLWSKVRENFPREDLRKDVKKNLRN